MFNILSLLVPPFCAHLSACDPLALRRDEETRYENGKRVTKTIESDASGTRAMMEEEQNGRSRAERHGTVVLWRIHGTGNVQACSFWLC